MKVNAVKWFCWFVLLFKKEFQKIYESVSTFAFHSYENNKRSTTQKKERKKIKYSLFSGTYFANNKVLLFVKCVTGRQIYTCCEFRDSQVKSYVTNIYLRQIQ